jgi:hypothetical protein
MVRRGKHIPQGQPAITHLVILLTVGTLLCVAWGILAKLVFETREGGKEYSFFCSSQPEATAAGNSHWGGMEKHPFIKRLRERARRRREVIPHPRATQQFQQQQQLVQQKH